jgi:PadR family transcriptional regulator PadR
MMEKAAVWQGTLALMVLKCLEVLGPQHGYGISRRIEQTSENVLSINHGTLYPVTTGIVARFLTLRGEG